MSNQTVETMRKAVGVGSIGFGLVATVAPRALRRAYGDAGSSGGWLDYLGRTWGTRTALLGAVTLMTSSDRDRRVFAGLAAGMNGVDALAAFGAAGLPATTRTMAGLTSAGFGAAAAYVAMNS